MDIVDTLEPSEEKVFYIADSHRPYDVCNIYNDGQVNITLFKFLQRYYLTPRLLGPYMTSNKLDRQDLIKN